mmetsp:Transcript_37660/g.89991  ORF Transcript_37660/g.89991 Transcript_37660/m.89991 type:complete len:204 (+) Transcript_37660:988-1599(+)
MACQSILAAVRIISGSLFINSGTCSKDRQLRWRMPITSLRPSFLSDPTSWTKSGSAMSESVTKGNTSFRWRMNFSIAAASDLSAVDAQSITQRSCISAGKTTSGIERTRSEAYCRQRQSLLTASRTISSSSFTLSAASCSFIASSLRTMDITPLWANMLGEASRIASLFCLQATMTTSGSAFRASGAKSRARQHWEMAARESC